jgi:hypothetical protein
MMDTDGQMDCNGHGMWTSNTNYFMMDIGIHISNLENFPRTG